jgi:HAD superfamily hydrolase (TIGR01549 family)
MTQFAISFDFWNTLFGDGQESERKIKRMNKLHEIANRYKNINPEAVESAFRVSSDYFLTEWKNKHRTPLSAERIQLMCDYLDVPVTPEEVIEAKDYFSAIVWEIPPVRLNNVHQVVEQLAGNFPLGIISDTGFIIGREIRSFLEKEGLLHHFSSLVFSDEFGHSKPHHTVFETTAETLGTETANLIHIGDLNGTDIKGANDVGATSICFTGANTYFSGNNDADHEIADYAELPELIATVTGGEIRQLP